MYIYKCFNFVEKDFIFEKEKEKNRLFILAYLKYCMKNVNNIRQITI